MTGATVAARPVQIVEFKTAIRDVSLEELTRIRGELQNNVRHLERSSERLRRYIAKLQGELKKEPDELDIEIEDDNIEQSDLQLFKDSLHENELVLRNYHERLEALDQEQLHRSPNVSSSGGLRVPKVGSEGEGEGVNSDNNPSDNNALNSVYL